MVKGGICHILRSSSSSSRWTALCLCIVGGTYAIDTCRRPWEANSSSFQLNVWRSCDCHWDNFVSVSHNFSLGGQTNTILGEGPQWRGKLISHGVISWATKWNCAPLPFLSFVAFSSPDHRKYLAHITGRPEYYNKVSLFEGSMYNWSLNNNVPPRRKLSWPKFSRPKFHMECHLQCGTQVLVRLLMVYIFWPVMRLSH